MYSRETPLACGREVEHALCDGKADGDEDVRGGEVGQHEHGRRGGGVGLRVAHEAVQRARDEQHKQRVREHCAGRARVIEREQIWHGSHRPIVRHVVRQHEQLDVEEVEVRVRQRAAESCGAECGRVVGGGEGGRAEA
eukprot:5142910-Pleurochrysis_carterae.AAC.1